MNPTTIDMVATTIDMVATSRQLAAATEAFRSFGSVIASTQATMEGQQADGIRTMTPSRIQHTRVGHT